LGSTDYQVGVPRRPRKPFTTVDIVNGRLKRAEQIVARQRELVLGVKGTPTAALAQRLLETMEAVLATMRAHSATLDELALHQMFARNALLRRLPAPVFGKVAKFLKPVALNVGDILVRKTDEIRAVYFPESALAGVTSPRADADDDAMEVGVVGNDGLVGTSVLFGVRHAPFTYRVRSPGEGLVMDAGALRDIADKEAPLRDALLRYAHSFQVQLAETAVSNGAAPVEQRLARTILMYGDRIDDDALSLTHEVFASVLGVRRASVTEALHKLEGVGAIRATRGSIHIRNRDTLERAAAGAHTAG